MITSSMQNVQTLDANGFVKFLVQWILLIHSTEQLNRLKAFAQKYIIIFYTSSESDFSSL